MEIATKKFTNFLLVFGLIAFLSVAFFGAFHIMGMQTQSDGTMGGCLFTGIDEICTMPLAEHLTAWQSMFTSIPAKSTILYLVVLAFALLLFASAFLKRYFIWAVERLAAIQRLYLVHHPNPSLFNPLQEAFSQGILNPKIY